MKRLLVLRLSALGDVIHTIPAVVALKEHYDVTWVVEAPYRELVEIVAGVKTIPVRMKKEPMSALRAVKQMRGFDVSIDFQGLIKSAALPWAARVKERVGFAEPREKIARWLATTRVAVAPSLHVIEQNLELIRPIRPIGPISPNWELFPQAIEARGEVVLLPGAGKPNKIWPHMRALAERLGARALVVWGPGEQVLAQSLGARMAPPTNLRELAFLLKSAQVVIGGDTGPLHLAAALGTKVIGLYGPTDPRRNGPYGQLQHVIDRFRSTKSMESISVEEVVKMLERVHSE